MLAKLSHAISANTSFFSKQAQPELSISINQPNGTTNILTFTKKLTIKELKRGLCQEGQDKKTPSLEEDSYSLFINGEEEPISDDMNINTDCNLFLIPKEDFPEGGVTYYKQKISLHEKPKHLFNRITESLSTGYDGEPLADPTYISIF